MKLRETTRIWYRINLVSESESQRHTNIDWAHVLLFRSVPVSSQPKECTLGHRANSNVRRHCIMHFVMRHRVCVRARKNIPSSSVWPRGVPNVSVFNLILYKQTAAKPIVYIVHNIPQRKNWANSAFMIKLVCTTMQIRCAYKFVIMRCASAYTVIIPSAIWNRQNVSSAPKVSHPISFPFYHRHWLHNIILNGNVLFVTNQPSLVVNFAFSVHPDMATLTSDLPTLLGVTTGIAVLAGLICLVLHLFSKNKYPNIRRFNDSGSHPPIIYSSDTGKCPLTMTRSVSTHNTHIRSKNEAEKKYQNQQQLTCFPVSLFALRQHSSIGPTIIPFKYPFK